MPSGGALRRSAFLPAALLLLTSSQVGCSAPPPAGAPGKPPAPASCAMPLPGSPQDAARASAKRGDHRLMAYQQNGFAVTLVIPAVRICEAGLRRGHHDAFSLVEISHGPTPCCDMRWTPNACGVRQENFAAAYNLEMIRVARREVKCPDLLLDPRVR